MKPLTVLELKDILREMDDDDLVFLRTGDTGDKNLYSPIPYDTTVYEDGHAYTEFNPGVAGQKTINALILD